MERDRALTLLAAQHSFPGPYQLRVIMEPAARASVLAALAAVDDVELREVEDHPSRRGTWVSVRVTLMAGSAEAVLAAYASVRGIAGVQMTL